MAPASMYLHPTVRDRVRTITTNPRCGRGEQQDTAYNWCGPSRHERGHEPSRRRQAQCFDRSCATDDDNVGLALEASSQWMRREEANHSRPTPGHIGRVETALPRPDGRGHVRRGHEALAPGVVQPQCKSAVLKKSPLEKRKAKKGTRRLGDWGGLQMTKWCLEPNSDSLVHARTLAYILPLASTECSLARFPPPWTSPSPRKLGANRFRQLALAPLPPVCPSC